MPGGSVPKLNWIGGSTYHPCSAVFVPPPPEFVAGLLNDLCQFCNDDSLPAVAQAAIAHAQFETIHPSLMAIAAQDGLSSTSSCAAAALRSAFCCRSH
jgi:hypothetical protein